MQVLRRSHEVFPPAKVGSDDIARLELPGSRLDDIADCAAAQRFTQFERRHIGLPFVHAAAHIRVHRHKEVANQHFLIFQWLGVGPRQREVRCGWNPAGAGGQANFPARKSRHKCGLLRRRSRRLSPTLGMGFCAHFRIPSPRARSSCAAWNQSSSGDPCGQPRACHRPVGDRRQRPSWIFSHGRAGSGRWDRNWPRRSSTRAGNALKSQSRKRHMTPPWRITGRPF